MNILFVALGGALGAVSRYLMSNFINKYCLGSFPLATFTINVIGCFCIGVFLYLFDKNSNCSNALKLFLITGFCGGFTTFSTFTVEQWVLFENKMTVQMIIYILLTVFLGLLCLLMGFVCAKFLNKILY